MMNSSAASDGSFDEQDAIRLSNKALTLAITGNYKEAIATGEACLEIDPGDMDTKMTLSTLYMRFGQVEAARKLLFDDIVEPDALFLLLQRRLTEVTQRINQCTKRKENQQWEELIGDAQSAIESGADLYVQLYLLKAEGFLKMHQWEDAERAISAARLTDFFGTRTSDLMQTMKSQIQKDAAAETDQRLL